jgi:hypothetical protein
VEAAAELAVLLGGEPALGPGDDVVGLTAVGGHVTRRVTAARLLDLEGPPKRAAEGAGVADAGDAVGPVEHHPRSINVSSSPSSPATTPGATTVPSASSHTRPAKVS